MKDIDARFWQKVVWSDDCAVFTSNVQQNGYARFWAGKTVSAHRWSYLRYIGKIPKGLTLDHLCRNRQCVNPLHLEAVTRKENILRGIGDPARNAKKTHCINGHPFDRKNTYIYNQAKYQNTPARGCRKCRIAAGQRYRRRFVA